MARGDNEYRRGMTAKGILIFPKNTISWVAKETKVAEVAS